MKKSAQRELRPPGFWLSRFWRARGNLPGMEESGRKHPAHGVQNDPETPAIVFLTVCKKGRARWLTCDEVHAALLGAWQEADAWRVGRYVLMPDHLHLFCGPQELEVSLEAWVRFWKGCVTRRLGQKGCGGAGSRIIGIRDCGAGRATRRNGSTCGKIRCGLSRWRLRKRGRIKARYMLSLFS